MEGGEPSLLERAVVGKRKRDESEVQGVLDDTSVLNNSRKRHRDSGVFLGNSVTDDGGHAAVCVASSGKKS